MNKINKNAYMFHAVSLSKLERPGGQILTKYKQ